MDDINSRTGNLLVISDDEDDDEEEQNNRDSVLTDSPPDRCLTDDDTSMSYGIDIKEGSDDINAISNDGQAVTDDIQTAVKTPDDIRHSDEVMSLKLGKNAKDDLADEEPYSDTVHNIFASIPSMLSMGSIPESITDQLKIGHIMASKLNLPETCKRAVDVNEDNLRKGTNSKEKEKIDSSQFPIVNKQSNSNEDNLRKGTHSNQKEKFDDSQFPVVNEQSNCNEDNLRKGTNSNEKEHIEDSPFPIQPNADPATLSVKDKLSSDDIRHSDEVMSLKLGKNAKDDLADEEPYSDTVHNIFASIPSMLSMGSIPESITDQLKIGHIMASKLNLPETCKRAVDVNEDNLRKGTNSKEKEKIDASQFPIVNKQSNSNEDNLRKGTHSNQKEKFDDSQFPVVNEQSNCNEDNLRKGTNSNEKEHIEDSPFPIQPNADPATLSVKDKLSLLQNNPSEPEKRDKPPVPITSMKDRRSSFEASLQTGYQQRPVPAPRRRTVQTQGSSITRRNSFVEPSLNKGAGEIGSKPERTSMHEQNPSFEAAREIAKRSSSGIPAKSSEHGEGEIESKPEWKTMFEHSSSFKAAREKAERTYERVYEIKSVSGVKDRTQIDVTPTQTTNKTQKNNTMVVAAIDFGTTFSAVAFSFTTDPEAIYAKTWDGQVKVPTVILLDPDKKLHSFGNDAKRAFSEKKDKQDTFEKWFYFDCFKMKLYVEDQYLQKGIKLKDFSGKEMAALDVFEKAISYMRGELLTLLNEKRRGVVINSTTDIHWVLTVPAIWPDLSKTFMREAAEKAGIPTDFLTLALEPEAASLFCKRKLDVDLRGKKYIILDLGGGTADFVCHEVQHDDSIKECHMPTGGAFGGKMVNDKFMERLISHYGAEIMKEFRRTKEYLDFIESFEIKKKNFDGTGDFVHIICSPTLNDIYQREIGEPIETSIQQSPRTGKLFWKQGKLVISRDIIQGMFDEPLKRIIETTRRIMKYVPNIDHIIMVGGFSNSKYIIQGIQQSFPEEGFVLTIDNPEVAVVKGAVRFGHENKAITSRISKYTYGIGRLMKFKPGDCEDYKISANGTTWCDNCFYKHIEVGEEMHCDDESGVKAHDYYPPDKDTKNFIIEVFASKDINPKYTTDEGCYPIGVLRLEMDTKGDVWSKVEVKLVFKGTELEIQALDVNSGKLTTGNVDFWS